MHFVIQQERIRRGWSQRHVGQSVGISAEAIGMIETAKRKPSYDVLVKLEDLFGLTHHELFAAARESPNLTAK